MQIPMLIKANHFAIQILLSLCLLVSNGLTFALDSVQVINIKPDLRVETLATSGQRQQVQLAGIKPHTEHPDSTRIFKLRLKTLILGKTVQLIPIRPGLARVNYSGMDVSERMLQEGAAELDPTTMQGIPMHVQQKYISAMESAYQSGRGLWQQNKSYSKRFHHPLWPTDRLPQPMTSAPVFRP